MKSWGRHLIWVGPLILGGGAIAYLYWRRNRKVPVNATDNTAPPVKAAPTPTDSAFPLRMGSRNNYVTQLQQALGISSDGIFGNQTESALRSAAGISMIADEKQFNEVMAKIKNAAAESSKSTRAIDLFNKFKTGKYAIQVKAGAFWYEVQKDAYGAYNRTGLGIQVKTGMIMNKNDYGITDTTKLGNVIVYCNKGKNLGSYTVDPNTITLVEQATEIDWSQYSNL